jgi:hypothetical protein
MRLIFIPMKRENQEYLLQAEWLDMSHDIVPTETKYSNIGALFRKKRFFLGGKDFRLIFIPVKSQNK